MEKKYFFGNVNDAVLYLIFLSLVPLISIYAQYAVSDRTMYISFFVAGFSMTYDYLLLFKSPTCKRLWTEALISSVCLIFAAGISIVKLVMILSEKVSLPYTWLDLAATFILVVVFLINVWEFILALRNDYAKKFLSQTSENNLMEGAKRV